MARKIALASTAIQQSRGHRHETELVGIWMNVKTDYVSFVEVETENGKRIVCGWNRTGSVTCACDAVRYGQDEQATLQEDTYRCSSC